MWGIKKTQKFNTKIYEKHLILHSQAFFTGIQGGDPLVGFASGALSSVASSLWVGVGPDNGGWHGIGGCAGSSDIGMVSFGVIMGGAGASLTGGNFWQGAATGLVVSGLNHLAHRVSSNRQDPPNKYARFFRSKINEIASWPKTVRGFLYQKSYSALRWSFDGMETVGGYMEIGGLIAAPFYGASLTVTTYGGYISTMGTFGNVGMDYFLDGNGYSASYRLFKWGTTLGMGKVIGKHVNGFDKIMLDLHVQFYDKVVVPLIENTSQKNNLQLHLN